MARRVFFSFHYENDINRSMTVQNGYANLGIWIESAAKAHNK